MLVKENEKQNPTSTKNKKPSLYYLSQRLLMSRLVKLTAISFLKQHLPGVVLMPRLQPSFFSSWSVPVEVVPMWRPRLPFWTLPPDIPQTQNWVPLEALSLLMNGTSATSKPLTFPISGAIFCSAMSKF